MSAEEVIAAAIDEDAVFTDTDGYRSIRMRSGEKYAEIAVAALKAAGYAVVQLPKPDGLFESPVPNVRFCGLAMGGYGTYDDLSTDEAVVEVIVPADMVSGHSIRDFNSPEGRHRFAGALLAAALWRKSND